MNAMTGLATGVSAVGAAVTVAVPRVYDVTAPTAAAPAAAAAVADQPVTASSLSLPLASNVVAQSSVATVTQSPQPGSRGEGVQIAKPNW